MVTTWITAFSSFIEKLDTPIGDGNTFPLAYIAGEIIEKLDTPIGDGNARKIFALVAACNIEKLDTPIGDGNQG